MAARREHNQTNLLLDLPTLLSGAFAAVLLDNSRGGSSTQRLSPSSSCTCHWRHCGVCLHLCHRLVERLEGEALDQDLGSHRECNDLPKHALAESRIHEKHLDIPSYWSARDRRFLLARRVVLHVAIE